MKNNLTIEDELTQFLLCTTPNSDIKMVCSILEHTANDRAFKQYNKLNKIQIDFE